MDRKVGENFKCGSGSDGASFGSGPENGGKLQSGVWGKSSSHDCKKKSRGGGLSKTDKQ